MFDEPEKEPTEHSSNPEQEAKDRSDKFRMHAELAAIFEGCRKFEARIVPGLDAEVARELQRSVGKLEKARMPDLPVIGEKSEGDARRVLMMGEERSLSSNDYHVHRRPGEVMVVRWLAGDQVETYYQRLQAHFEAGWEGFREDERQAHEWQKDPKTLAYLDALDKVEVKMAERYLREIIREHRIFVLSTQVADELNIAYLADHVMGVPAAEIVGRASAPATAPGDEPEEKDLAWFFKLFSLRGIVETVERMCFFAYLQKSDDVFDDGE